jgi:hypothetical protein
MTNTTSTEAIAALHLSDKRRRAARSWKAIFLGVLLTLLGGAVFTGCGEAEDGVNAGTALSFGAFCATGFAGDCPAGICRDVVGGESCDGGTCADWNRDANQGTVCTKSCNDDSQCQDMSFAVVNGEQVSSEEWFCSSGTCHVFVTAPVGQVTDVCTGCGGVFCSGRCIGCPQC